MEGTSQTVRGSESLQEEFDAIFARVSSEERKNNPGVSDLTLYGFIWLDRAQPKEIREIAKQRWYELHE